ncbi:hypothetical protein Leryth_023083 [Lithospermum erythrorhizon]|nr:hypothetical protein Leryth_023083 [Lithospermum erythrorhizon]
MFNASDSDAGKWVIFLRFHNACRGCWFSDEQSTELFIFARTILS